MYEKVSKWLIFIKLIQILVKLANDVLQEIRIHNITRCFVLEIFFCLVLLPTKSKNNTSVYSISLTHFKLTGLLDQYNHCKNATSQLIKIGLIVWSRRDTRSAVWHEILVATINYTFICSEGHMIKTILSTGVFGTYKRRNAVIGLQAWLWATYLSESSTNHVLPL